MKFWKLTLLSALGFFAISATVLYTSCSVDTCADVKCVNGGACIDGYCQCPTGYEGANCATETYKRFIGTYTGNTQCDLTPAIFDTAVIFLEQFPSNVGVALFSHRTDSLWQTDTLHGTLTAGSSNISVPDYYAPRYSRHIVVTLATDRLNIYDESVHYTGVIVVDTNKTICNFYGLRLKQ